MLYHPWFANTHARVRFLGCINTVRKYNTTPPFLKFVQNYLLSIFSRALSEDVIILFGLLRMFKGGITGLSEADTVSVVAVVTEVVTEEFFDDHTLYPLGNDDNAH